MCQDDCMSVLEGRASIQSEAALYKSLFNKESVSVRTIQNLAQAPLSQLTSRDRWLLAASASVCSPYSSEPTHATEEEDVSFSLSEATCPLNTDLLAGLAAYEAVS
ncbi:hypothetical protein KIPB_016393, partial [Kipferlia bialata]|eukprot:g16393.t1